MRTTPGRALAWFFAALVVAAAFWAAFALGRRSAADGRISSAPVVLAIKRIAQLATVEVEVADVVRYEEVRTILVFDFPKGATLRLRGRVTGGFDLQPRFSAVHAEPTQTVVRVRLPPPRLLALDPRIEWFDEKGGWINPITPADRNRWMLRRAARWAARPRTPESNRKPWSTRASFSRHRAGVRLERET